MKPEKFKMTCHGKYPDADIGVAPERYGNTLLESFTNYKHAYANCDLVE